MTQNCPNWPKNDPSDRFYLPIFDIDKIRLRILCRIFKSFPSCHSRSSWPFLINPLKLKIDDSDSSEEKSGNSCSTHSSKSSGTGLVHHVCVSTSLSCFINFIGHDDFSLWLYEAEVKQLVGEWLSISLERWASIIFVIPQSEACGDLKGWPILEVPVCGVITFSVDQVPEDSLDSTSLG